MSDQRPSFREQIDGLEAIVRALEADELDLDKALELFEEGVRKLKTARELLQGSELTVQRVLEEADGTIGTDDVDL